MNNLIIKNKKPCCEFTFVSVPYDISTIKPWHVFTYCNCKCIEINIIGSGLFELCETHTSKVQQLDYGDLLIPSVEVRIPLQIKGKIISYLRRKLRDFTGIRFREPINA